jgi:hypothetical protein
MSPLPLILPDITAATAYFLEGERSFGDVSESIREDGRYSGLLFTYGIVKHLRQSGLLLLEVIHYRGGGSIGAIKDFVLSLKYGRATHPIPEANSK